jgi:hypothetical protein
MSQNGPRVGHSGFLFILIKNSYLKNAGSFWPQFGKETVLSEFGLWKNLTNCFTMVYVVLSEEDGLAVYFLP